MRNRIVDVSLSDKRRAKIVVRFRIIGVDR